MNPYSHDDIETPLYRTELKQAIEDVERLSKINKIQLIKDQEIGSRVFMITIANGFDTVTAIFCFIERFERVTYNDIRYYGASKIHVKTISRSSINTSVGNYDVRKLYKDMYESVHYTATTRPIFEDCIQSVADSKPLSTF